MSKNLLAPMAFQAGFCVTPPHATAQPICHSFNFSIHKGIVPQLQRTANVVPMHKSQPSRSIDDLRPTYLIPTFSKVLEAAVGAGLGGSSQRKL
jgi:hypothetical protein